MIFYIQGYVVTISIKSFVHNSATTTSNDISSIFSSDHSLQNYQKTLKKCFIDFRCIVMEVTVSNVRPHNSVLAVLKELIYFSIEHFNVNKLIVDDHHYVCGTEETFFLKKIVEKYVFVIGHCSTWIK